MIKKKITYESFDGKPVTEDFYFNLTQAEIAEVDLEIPGGINAFRDLMENNPTMKDLVKIFKLLIGKAIATKDGVRISKSEALSSEFLASDAYSVLFFELIGDENKMMDFFNGIIPASARDRLATEKAALEKPLAEKVVAIEAVKESDPVAEVKADA